jgi:outer membrane lipoprotein SlyB
MKNLIAIIAVASVLYACNGVNSPQNGPQQNEDMKSELMQARHEAEIQKLQSQLDVHKAKQSAIDSMQSVAIASGVATRQGLSAESRATQRVSDDWTASERTTSSRDAYRPSVNTTPVAVKQKKKGLSTPAKGAIIGGTVGAATGAIVSKKKVQGAVVGAVVGAGAGAATGVIIDKRKEKRAATTPDYSYASYLK